LFYFVIKKINKKETFATNRSEDEMAGWHRSISLSKISARKQFKGTVNKLFTLFVLDYH